LTLALAGWLIYALTRALGLMIAMGTMFYDWQWYLALTLLLVSLTTHFLVRHLRPRLARLLFSVLGIWLIAGYSSFGQRIRLEPGQYPPVLISFWAYSDFRQSSERLLNDLQAAGGRIYLDTGNSFSGERGQALAAGLRRLAEHNLEVYLVPTASDFLSVPTRREWIANVQDVVAFIQREHLENVRGLIGDAEHPMHTPFDPFGLDRNGVSQTVFDFRSLQTALHHEHPDLRLGVTTTWPQYADGLDGDSDLALILRSPVDPPGGWDFIDLMTYSSYFPASWRAYYVYWLERAMQLRYPQAEVSHLIGLVGGGFPWEPLLDFDELARDGRLSRALGVREIIVFQLDGALKTFGDDFVRRLTVAINGPQSEPVLVPFSRPASVIFYGLAVADALLDVRGQGWWLGLSWVIVSGLITRANINRPPHVDDVPAILRR
jgi:hypothetical protein